MNIGHRPWNPGRFVPPEFPLRKGADFAGYVPAPAGPNPWAVALPVIAGAVFCAATVVGGLLLFWFMAGFARGMGP